MLFAFFHFPFLSLKLSLKKNLSWFLRFDFSAVNCLLKLWGKNDIWSSKVSLNFLYFIDNLYQILVPIRVDIEINRAYISV